jgi:hypothetical protein
MPDDWKEYKEWKELLENMRRSRDDDIEFVYDDDDMNDSRELFSQFID